MSVLVKANDDFYENPEYDEEQILSEPHNAAKPQTVKFIIVCACVMAVFLLSYFAAPVWATIPLIALVFLEPSGYKTEYKVFLIVAILIIAVFSYFFGFTGSGAVSSEPMMTNGGNFSGGYSRGGVVVGRIG